MASSSSSRTTAAVASSLLRRFSSVSISLSSSSNIVRYSASRSQIVLRALSSTSSSSTSLPPPPFRLRRPARFDIFRRPGGAAGGAGSGPPFDDGDDALSSGRPHAITFFPGDFTDDDGKGDVWGKYDDDADEDDWISMNADGSSQDPELLDESAYLEELRREEELLREKKARWIATAEKPIRTSIIDEHGRSYGRGARKTAQARVWITPGLGEIVVNRRPFVDYFERMSDREIVLSPFVATETCGAFDIQAYVKGGGLTGQANALRLGLSRALNAYDPDRYRPPLKFLGYLTRDARKVERKKVGRVKARKSPQWVRR